MTSIGLPRLLARCGMHLIVDGLRWKNPTIGRQGKSAASGRAQVVGWVKIFGYSDPPPGRRLTSKPQQFQRPGRHRTLLQPVQPVSAP
jgi:hypothetical protein